jgi:hypothetical protein
MVCHTSENETWYWEGEKCVLCEGEKQNAIIFFAVAFGTGLLLVVDAVGPGISRKIIKRAKEMFRSRCPKKMDEWIEKQKEFMEELTLKLQTKCNLTKLHPAPVFIIQINLPARCGHCCIIYTLFAIDYITTQSLPFLLQIKSSLHSSRS